MASVFSVRCLIAWYAVIVCLSVGLSICVSHADIVAKRLNAGSRKQRHTIAQGLWFSEAKDLGEILTGLLPMGAPNIGAVGSNWRFLTNILLYLRNRAR